MKNSVTKETIDKILSKTLIKVEKYGDKTTVIMATLPNGFVIVKHSSCVDLGGRRIIKKKKICMERLVNKIWELEGYKLQSKIHENEVTSESI